MKQLTVYRILSYILLPVAALLAFLTLLALIVSLGNVAMLFSAFITGATVIYIFSSFSFLQNGIDRQAACKPKLKDWIKVNGYVALFFAVMGLIQGIVVLSNPGATKMIMDNFMTMQATELKAPEMALMLKIMKAVLWFMVVFSAILLFHISTTFKLLRQYKHVFGA
jgi:hypothetical protein